MDSVIRKLVVGQFVSCTDFQDLVVEGELISFDIPFKIIVLKFPASNGKASNCNIKLINLQYAKELKILKESKRPDQPLSSINLSKLTSRVKTNSDAKMKQVEYHGIGVTPLAQELLNSISKIITEVCWRDDNIVVMNEVRISPPYFSSDCHGPVGSQALHLVKNLVEKFHRENNSQHRIINVPST